MEGAVMRSIITADDGRVLTVYNGEQDGGRWTIIPDGEYVHPRDRPTGYAQARYIKAESGLEFDRETEYMGVVLSAIVEIDAPDTIQNDDTETEVALTTETEDTITADLTIDDMTETVEINGEHTETLTTTLDAGETITVSVGGDGVKRSAVDIEVVEQ